MHDVIPTVTLLRFSAYHASFQCKHWKSSSPVVVRNVIPCVVRADLHYQIMQEQTANYSIIQLEICTFERLKHL